MPEWRVFDRVNEIVGCEHSDTIFTKATKSNGVVCVYIQCVKCGEKIKETAKAGHNLAKLPAFDTGLRDRVRKHNRRVSDHVRDEWYDELESDRQEKNQEWHDKYENGYLRSHHWQRLRRQVIFRDNWTCQNCFRVFDEREIVVHHLSYDAYNRLGKSFAFECVTLCRNCHDEFHGRTA